jgi:hypothetical protein
MSLSAKTDIILDRTLHQRSLCHSDVGVSGQHVALPVRLFDALRIHGDDHVCTRRQDPVGVKNSDHPRDLRLRPNSPPASWASTGPPTARLGRLPAIHNG